MKDSLTVWKGQESHVLHGHELQIQVVNQILSVRDRIGLLVSYGADNWERVETRKGDQVFNDGTPSGNWVEG